MGLLWLAVQLPYRAQLRLGRTLGRLFYPLVWRWRLYTLHNLRLCFPEKSGAEIRHLARRHFEAIGISLLEIGMSWWAPGRRLRDLGEVVGMEHLERARRNGRGVILLTAHFTSFEIGGSILGQFIPFDVMYRHNKNAVLEYLIRRARNRHADNVIRSDQTRRILKRLREGATVWYAPDLAYTRQNYAMVDFFGHPAPTNTATSRLAKASGAVVLPYYPERLPGTGGYRLHLLPPLDDFPGDDAIADTERTNRILEDQIRAMPEQYMWSFDRFKARLHKQGQPNKAS
jgi:KDO2-lipid IV(A) lauroyltransferase